MDGIVRRCLTMGFACGAALLVLPGLCAGQEPPLIDGVTGTIALEGTVDQEYNGANTVIVKTIDGLRHLFHLTEKTVVHGTESAGANALSGLEAGSSASCTTQQKPVSRPRSKWIGSTTRG